ncbi:hypothetical protein JD844_026621 [Phrynosoma platyrhinos]|uniref:Phosphodiesterase n=1 Tax=Phrynosoma platyrhinos TaxID=52577 RepID=A0ABQ7SF42_PHRPL|nr:hypothetical protein JD844_026621 [Phrynosoma platyrhinos]
MKGVPSMVVGVAQAINKKSGGGGVFTEQDEKVLLDLASLIFEEQQSLEVILKKIAATIISFMQDSFSSVFHMEFEELEDSNETHKRNNSVFLTSTETMIQTKLIICMPNMLRIPWSLLTFQIFVMTRDFLGHKSTDSNHSLAHFYVIQENESTDTANQNIESLLCTPIKNGKKNKVIGVCQLANKMEENSGKIKAFNRNDEQFLEAFVIFCGLGIQNTQMYEAVERAMAKQMVTLEILSYHASAAEEEARELQVTAAAVVPSAQSLKLTDFYFSDFELSDMETSLCTIRMFTDLNLVLCRWILSVRKNYRKNVAYHNWRHAFNTAQCMFAALKSGKIQNKLTDVEVLSLLIAALSHDLDHRGVNNSYIQRSEHPLAQLYCHSIMEHHHFDQCLMILNTPGNQILSGLSVEEYKATLKMIKQAILATDLALYIKRRGEFFDLLRKKQFNLEDPYQKELFLGVAVEKSVKFMYKLSLEKVIAETEKWRRIAELVAAEFFDQGDKERKELNIEPTDLMNREKKNKIPSMQVGFIDAICLQLYEALAHISESCYPLLEGCRKNRQKWQALAEQQENNLINGESNQSKRN